MCVCFRWFFSYISLVIITKSHHHLQRAGRTLSFFRALRWPTKCPIWACCATSSRMPFSGNVWNAWLSLQTECHPDPSTRTCTEGPEGVYEASHFWCLAKTGLVAGRPLRADLDVTRYEVGNATWVDGPPRAPLSFEPSLAPIRPREGHQRGGCLSKLHTIDSPALSALASPTLWSEFGTTRID